MGIQWQGADTMKKLVVLVSFLSLFSLTSLSQKSDPLKKYYNRNLLKNPGAEMKQGRTIRFWDDDSGQPGTRGIDRSIYGQTAGEYDVDWGKPRGFGDYYFRLGADQDWVLDSKEQIISLTALHKSIDLGHVGYHIDGHFSTYANGFAQLVAVFLDKNDKTLGTDRTPLLHLQEITNESNLIKKESSGIVPKKTASVAIYLEATIIKREGYGANSAWLAFADNLSFSLYRIKK